MREVASASIRVGHLVKQAMIFLETDRQAARRCLSQASTLLDPESQDSGAAATGRPGDLAGQTDTRLHRGEPGI
jgi:hypothetical protein